MTIDKFSNTIIKWDNPLTKYSHPNKTLKIHLDEVEKIFYTFARYYNIQEKAINLTLSIIRYHDNGKLNPLWSVNNNKNPPHSEYSIQYLKEMRLIQNLKQQYSIHFPLILYLILKHHSSLYDRTNCKNEDLKTLCQDVIRHILKEKISINERIEIVDSFGLFKLADSLSASNSINFKPIEPNINTKLVRNILSEKQGFIDEIRWKEQQNLLSLPNAALLTAYTGWGKTDSALLFCATNQVKKVFYLFPMITALNKFYDKLNRFMNNHVEKYFYLYEYELASKSGESIDESQEFLLSSFVASHFLQPVILTTIDQFLLAFLQLGKYYMKRVMFRNASIVIDEVHLINPKMLSLFFQFIDRFMPIYNLRILFMSATFSEALMNVIKDHIPNIQVKDLSHGYKELLRIKYELHFDKTILDEDIHKIEDYLNAGKKVLVVANTVETSVLLYRKIEKELKNSGYKLLLLHGKFMYRDRKPKEDEIENLKNKPHVLVTTQVCEVSLDASYELLLTEIAPIPSLIQRFGRVNRYGKRTDSINVHIYKEYRKKIYYDKPYPYEQSDIDLSKKVLNEIQPLTSEYDLIRKFNEIENYGMLTKKMEDAKNEIHFETFWENIDQRTGYFFSFKMDEEKIIKSLLEFRDNITANILPDPLCISDKCLSDRNIKKELENLLDMWNKRSTLNPLKINYILKMFRGYFVAVPLRLLAKNRPLKNKGLPLVMFNNLVYTSKYGFIEKELNV